MHLPGALATTMQRGGVFYTSSFASSVALKSAPHPSRFGESDGASDELDLSRGTRLVNSGRNVVDRLVLFLETDLKSNQVDSPWETRKSTG